MYWLVEVKSRPLGYSRMRSFFPILFGRRGGWDLNSSIFQRTTLAGCRKTWQNLETPDSVTLLDNWSPALPVRSGKTSSFMEVPIKLSSQRCTFSNTTFFLFSLSCTHSRVNHKVNCTGSVSFFFFFFFGHVSQSQIFRACKKTCCCSLKKNEKMDLENSLKSMLNFNARTCLISLCFSQSASIYSI